MAERIRDVMTSNPTTLPQGATVVEAARAMRDGRIGDVLVLDAGGKLRGILTDRDIVVRALAEGRDPGTTPIEEVSSDVVVTVSPEDRVDQAVRLMRERAIRRLPVVEDGRPVGVVSLGDLATLRDPLRPRGDQLGPAQRVAPGPGRLRVSAARSSPGTTGRSWRGRGARPPAWPCGWWWPWPPPSERSA